MQKGAATSVKESNIECEEKGFQQVDVNLGPGCKELFLNRRFLPFKPSNTLTTLESTQNPVPTWSSSDWSRSSSSSGWS
ncbi:unnamed protein product [Sphagnum troendelagicum]|uniref:Uncharacterized protein n=1 Tax=Sphagnum troendelagicum TaxID=128251 RepID=A0ABP0TYN7_9BRYO